MVTCQRHTCRCGDSGRLADLVLGGWQVSSILTLSDVQIDLTNDCGDGTQPACPKGELFLKLGTNARLAPR